jgi:capsular polysaccharide biosynthesis protein
MNERVETRRVILGVARKWWLILLLTLLAGAVGYAASLRIDPTYQAASSILVGQPFQDPNPDKDSIESIQQLTFTYADVISRQPVLAAVVRDLNLDTSWQKLRDWVRVEIPPDNSQLIVVTVEAGSPDLAEKLARGVVKRAITLSPTESQLEAAAETQVFVRSRLETLEDDIRKRQKRIDDLQGVLNASTDDQEIEDLQLRIDNTQRLIIASQETYSSFVNFLAEEEFPNHMQVLEPAEASLTPVRPDVLLYSVLAGGVGFLLALGLAYFLEFRQHTEWGQGATITSGGHSKQGHGRHSVLETPVAASSERTPHSRFSQIAERADREPNVASDLDFQQNETYGSRTPNGDEVASSGRRGPVDRGPA